MRDTKRLLLAFGFFLVGLQISEAYRILGFHPVPGKSQHHIFAPILHQLAVRGHNVVYVTCVKPDFSHPNLEVRLVPDYQEQYFEVANSMLTLWDPPLALDTYLLFRLMAKMAPHMYGVPAIQALIHSENETFDAVTLESYLMAEPASAFIHKFSCPAIEISTFGSYVWLNELAGLSDNVAFQSDVRIVLPNKMTFWERVYNFYAKWSLVLASYYILSEKQHIMDHYFNYTGWENRPSIYNLISNRSIILVNQDEGLAYSQPLPPHVKNIGGVNINPRKPLPEDLQKWMDGATNGVIYLSFGSNLRTSDLMRTVIGDVFIKVFRDLPQRIIMKWEKGELPDGMPNNILFYKWVPQQDVLAHKNCRAFITHGGFLSLTEAVYNGVPLVGIPFFWDQPKNLFLAESYGYGLTLNIDNITYESVHWVLNELLNNKRYKEEALRRSQILKDRRYSAIDEAVFWVEHSIKYPNALTPQAANLSFIQLHLIDVKSFILFVLFVFYKTTKSLILRIRGKISSFVSKKKID